MPLKPATMADLTAITSPSAPLDVTTLLTSWLTALPRHTPCPIPHEPRRDPTACILDPDGTHHTVCYRTDLDPHPEDNTEVVFYPARKPFFARLGLAVLLTPAIESRAQRHRPTYYLHPELGILGVAGTPDLHHTPTAVDHTMPNPDLRLWVMPLAAAHLTPEGTIVDHPSTPPPTTIEPATAPSPAHSPRTRTQDRGPRVIPQQPHSNVANATADKPACWICGAPLARELVHPKYPQTGLHLLCGFPE